MSDSWADLHGGGAKARTAALVAPVEAAPLAAEFKKLDADWWVLWYERCRFAHALFEIENRAKALGDWGTAHMARRARIGKVAVEHEDRAIAELAAASAPEIQEEEDGD